MTNLLRAVVLMTVATAWAMAAPFSFAPAVAASTYYVSVSGNNSNPGTEAQPFGTIQQAIASAGPGDTIIVKPGRYGPAYAEGTYGHAEWNANRNDGRGGTSGTATAGIVLKAENPATEVPESQRAIIEGNGSGFGLYLNGFDYITIDGFEITNFATGIGLQAQSSHLIIRRNILRSNTAVGIECASCSDNLFEYNAFLDPGPPYPELDDAVQDYGLNFFQESANNVVVHNYFFGKHNQALSWKRRAGPGYAAFNTFEGFMYTAVYLGQNDDEAEGGDMTSFDVTVEYNVFRDAVDEDTGAYYRGRSPITIRNINNAIVRYNYIENMSRAAIYVRGCEGGYYCDTVAGKRPVGAKIYGNTIVNGKIPDAGSVVNPPDDPSGAIGTPVAFYISGRGYDDDHIEIYNNTIYNTDQALAISGTPDYITTRESPNPPKLTIKNNNFVNVGNGGVVFVEDTATETTTFAHNNWYELDNADINNGQDSTDVHFNPLFVGPLTVFPPQSGPNLVFDADFSRSQAYKLSGTSLLVDAGIDVGLSFIGAAPDIGSNEFIADLSVSDKPFPAGDAPPFGWTACEDMARCRDDGFTLIHRGYYGNISGSEADQWAQDAVALGITKNFVNTTPFDMMRDNPLSEQYSLWKTWFQEATSTVGPGTILGYYLPDEPEPSQGEYDKVNEIMRALKDVDPEALGVLYDGGVNPDTLATILGETEPGVDVLLDGGYPVLHPEYGGHGWVYARLREIEGVVKTHGKTIWMVTEGFDDACAVVDAKERAKSHMALGILGGAQGVMTYAYIYSVDTPCYTAHLEFLPLYWQLWPWIKTGDKTELPVTVTSGPATSPLYNLSHAASYTSVAAWLFTDEQGQKMLGAANLLDDATVGATIGGVPAGTWEVLGEDRSITVSADGTLADSWASLGYHFYLLGGSEVTPTPTPVGPSPTPTNTPTPEATETPTATPTPIPSGGSLTITADDDDGSDHDGLWLSNGWSTTDNEPYHIFGKKSWAADFDTAYRFQNVTVPRNATIESAVLKWHIYDYDGDYWQMNIKGIAQDSTGPFSSSDLPSSRPTTIAAQTWTIPSVTIDQWMTSPDLSPIIQEIIDHPGWESGNALGLYVENTVEVGFLYFSDYNRHPSYAPTLEITYSHITPTEPYTSYLPLILKTKDE